MADREKRAALTRSTVSRLGDEDRHLQELIRKTLIEDPVLWSDDIAIRVKQGRVILEGVVESHAQKERAESVISGLLGVKAVENDLVVSQSHIFSEKQVLDFANQAMSTAPFAARDVSLSLRNGMLSINGHVDTLWEKLKLIELLDPLPGIKETVSQLKIGYENPPDDVSLRNKVILAISELPRLKVQDLKVRVVHGTTYLKGEADRAKDKQSLLEKVAKVKGVKEIVDEIESQHEEATENDLRRKLEIAFRDEPRLAGAQLQFDLAGATLFLRGDVKSGRQLHVIEEILQEIPAIRRIVNEISIRT
jgi:hyperosmotically inducible protein